MPTATKSEPPVWLDEHQEQLVGALRRVKGTLQQQLDDPVEAGAATTDDTEEHIPWTLASLCHTFDLSPFERDLLLLCAGMELEAGIGMLCARLHENPQRPYPTFGLALAVLPGAHWSALTPAAPLRYWRLLDLLPGSDLTQSQLRIDERILHYLTGVHHLDEQLMGFVEPLGHEMALVPSQEALARDILAVWSRSEDDRPPAIQLCGAERYGQQAIAAAVCRAGQMSLYRLDVHVLPTTPHELDILQRLWEREAALSGCALLLDTHGLDTNDAARQAAARQFLERLNTPLFIAGIARRHGQRRALLTYEVDKPTEAEQRALWRQTLGDRAPGLNGQVARMTSQFHLDAPTIRAATWQAAGEKDGDLPAHLWAACRAQARPQLDDLAQRIESLVTWDDLILPERELATLHDITLHLQQRQVVYEQWGFARKSRRGLGLSALFAGPSGTGKTLAAEVLANELALDLYKIDLSQVVSKYIGETEKNLARVFDAAEAGGAILLFDEADALFGKRSEVKDSHDRYANIEISYLLQRMEAYRGLAILTTNMKQALDNAFLRRLRFIVNFRFPDIGQRAAIWERIYPADTPTRGLDWGKLAQLNVAGGNIRNIALNAAFYAAASREPVGMAHVLRAARAEYAKLDKSLSSAEIRGWE